MKTETSSRVADFINHQNETKAKRRLPSEARRIFAECALILTILVGIPLPAQADRDTRRIEAASHWFYRDALRTMLFHARRAGVTIDRDIDVLLMTNVDSFFATVDGFESLKLRSGAAAGVNVGFVYLRGVAEIPDGFYTVQFVIDPGDLANGFAWLINARGERIRRPLMIADDPHPERGPRKSVISEGGGAALTHYVYTEDDLCICLITADPKPLP